MNQNLGASIVLAVGLIVASVLVGGIYESHTASENAAFIWRVNRFTGSMIRLLAGFQRPEHFLASILRRSAEQIRLGHYGPIPRLAGGVQRVAAIKRVAAHQAHRV
jgi:hypothetical protein